MAVVPVVGMLLNIPECPLMGEAKRRKAFEEQTKTSRKIQHVKTGLLITAYSAAFTISWALYAGSD